MRALLVLPLFVLSSLARAQEEPPPPPVERPADAPEPLIPEDTDGDSAPGEVEAAPDEAGEPVEPPAPHDASPKPDAKTDAKPDAKTDDKTGGLGGGACWGATTGCGAFGCLPGLGTGLGATVLITFINAALTQGGAGGVCLAVLGISGGVVIGAPSVLILGPCASGGAIAGGVAGAILDDREIWPAVIGGLPGVAVGLLGTAGAVWGLTELGNASGDYLLPATLLGISAAAALSAGPLSIAGITIADAVSGGPVDGEQDGKEKKNKRDTRDKDHPDTIEAAWRAPPMAY